MKTNHRRGFLKSIAGVIGSGLAYSALATGATESDKADYLVTDYGARPDRDELQTGAIQAAIDAAGQSGGGTVRIPRGRFLTGAVQLRDNIRLVLDDDAVLQGSSNWRDYGQGRWLDALITARDIRNVQIVGRGRIDGADCHNPKGEEGFRGPHTVVLTNCRGIEIEGISLVRSGNYAILCRDCAEAKIRDVSVRGGHDSLHAQACAKFAVCDCDFRSGDDCLAGCDNLDFEVTGCKINSSCNGFRLGCLNLLVKDCTFWGPGEYPHLVSARRGPPRTNMLSAFVHFAPKDRNPKMPSDNWLVQDCTIDNADCVYAYDFERGLWQTGQPAMRLRFVNVKATRIARPLRVLGDEQRQFALTLENVAITLREDQQDRPVLDLNRFGCLELRNVRLQNGGQSPVLIARDGNTIVLDRVRWIPERDAPYTIERIETVRTDRDE